ncbi:hypothetical protein M0813_28621 [Anaeramoeba flamelloides]|uniref:Uncharacterized protein n=1 Tax=Anaeramoeba flamelloides TaxID=1746091 RepID=A0ABQ8XTF1_9EUKA|nr:hypothetical protein M0813_28621 [Anaeramoeba flamelloides]
METFQIFRDEQESKNGNLKRLHEENNQNEKKQNKNKNKNKKSKKNKKRRLTVQNSPSILKKTSSYKATNEKPQTKKTTTRKKRKRVVTFTPTVKVQTFQRRDGELDTPPEASPSISGDENSTETFLPLPSGITSQNYAQQYGLVNNFIINETGRSSDQNRRLSLDSNLSLCSPSQSSRNEILQNSSVQNLNSNLIPIHQQSTDLSNKRTSILPSIDEIGSNSVFRSPKNNQKLKDQNLQQFLRLSQSPTPFLNFGNEYVYEMNKEQESPQMMLISNKPNENENNNQKNDQINGNNEKQQNENVENFDLSQIINQKQSNSSKKQMRPANKENEPLINFTQNENNKPIIIFKEENAFEIQKETSPKKKKKNQKTKKKKSQKKKSQKNKASKNKSKSKSKGKSKNNSNKKKKNNKKKNKKTKKKKNQMKIFQDGDNAENSLTQELSLNLIDNSFLNSLEQQDQEKDQQQQSENNNDFELSLTNIIEEEANFGTDKQMDIENEPTLELDFLNTENSNDFLKQLTEESNLNNQNENRNEKGTGKEKGNENLHKRSKTKTNKNKNVNKISKKKKLERELEIEKESRLELEPEQEPAPEQEPELEPELELEFEEKTQKNEKNKEQDFKKQEIEKTQEIMQIENRTKKEIKKEKEKRTKMNEKKKMNPKNDKETSQKSTNTQNLNRLNRTNRSVKSNRSVRSNRSTRSNRSNRSTRSNRSRTPRTISTGKNKKNSNKTSSSSRRSKQKQRQNKKLKQFKKLEDSEQFPQDLTIHDILKDQRNQNDSKSNKKTLNFENLNDEKEIELEIQLNKQKSSTVHNGNDNTTTTNNNNNNNEKNKKNLQAKNKLKRGNSIEASNQKQFEKIENLNEHNNNINDDNNESYNIFNDQLIDEDGGNVIVNDVNQNEIENENKQKIEKEKQIKQISLDEFCEMYGIRFLDEILVNNPITSMGGDSLINKSNKRPKSVSEKMITRMICQTEINNINKGCKKFREFLKKLKIKNEQLVKSINTTNPKIFKVIQRSKNNFQIENYLKNLQNFTKFKSKTKLLKTIKKVEIGIISDLERGIDENKSRISNCQESVNGISNINRQLTANISQQKKDQKNLKKFKTALITNSKQLEQMKKKRELKKRAIRALEIENGELIKIEKINKETNLKRQTCLKSINKAEQLFEDFQLVHDWSGKGNYGGFLLYLNQKWQL